MATGPQNPAEHDADDVARDDVRNSSAQPQNTPRPKPVLLGVRGHETTVLLFCGRGDYLQGFVAVNGIKRHVIAHINARKSDVQTGETKPNFITLSEPRVDGAQMHWRQIGYGNAINRRGDGKPVHFDEMLFNVGREVLSARVTHSVDAELHRRLGFLEPRTERAGSEAKATYAREEEIRRDPDSTDEHIMCAKEDRKDAEFIEATSDSTPGVERLDEVDQETREQMNMEVAQRIEGDLCAVNNQLTDHGLQVRCEFSETLTGMSLYLADGSPVMVGGSPHDQPKRFDWDTPAADIVNWHLQHKANSTHAAPKEDNAAAPPSRARSKTKPETSPQTQPPTTTQKRRRSSLAASM